MVFELRGSYLWRYLPTLCLVSSQLAIRVRATNILHRNSWILPYPSFVIWCNFGKRLFYSCLMLHVDSITSNEMKREYEYLRSDALSRGSVRIQSRVSLLSRDWRQVQFDECQKRDEPHNQVFLAGNFSLVISAGPSPRDGHNHVDESILLRVRVQCLAMAVQIGPSFSA